MSDEINMEQAILHSATRLFLEKGFKATSTTEIAKLAGCNQALVHYYYRTKDRLFEAIFQKKMKLFLGVLIQIDHSDASFSEKISRKIEAHFDEIKRDPKLPLFFFSELSANPKRIDSIKELIGDLPQIAFKQLDAELQEEVKKGNVRPMSFKDLLLTIVSLNIIPFMGAPMFKLMTNTSEEEYNRFIEHRKKENVRIVLNSLKP